MEGRKGFITEKQAAELAYITIQEGWIKSNLTEDGYPEEMVARFYRYLITHLEIWEAFEGFAKQAISVGRKHYGSMGIINRIRWHTDIERNEGEFKVNHDFTPMFARLFMMKYPEHEGFFRTAAVGCGRKIRSDSYFY